MDSQTINFITWNVNGLKKNKDQKFQELQNADVVFLQETHIGVGDEEIEDYKNEWNLFYTKYNSSSRGTAILVSKSLDFEYISDERDNRGRYVVLKCKLEGRLYTLVSVYNHQTDEKTLDNLSRYLQSMTTGLLVIGGDFNTFHNPILDKKRNTCKRAKQFFFVERFMDSLQLADVWRRKNLVKRDFTFYRRDHPESRLDYFFIPEECMWRVESCEIMDAKMRELKDHRLVCLQFNNVSTVPLMIDQTQTHFQLLMEKKNLLTDQTGSSQGEESSDAVSEVDIVSAVHSLQVSDTARPDDIPVSFYKDNIQDAVPYVKMFYDNICNGEFKWSDIYFEDSQDETPLFFNADYLIIATILARRLDDFLKSTSQGTLKDSATVIITCKTLCTQEMLCCLEDEIEEQEESHSTLYQAVKNLLDGAEYLRCQGCPLKPVLTTLGIKRYALQLCRNLGNYAVHVFKPTVMVCLPLKDLDKVENRTNDKYIVTVSKGRGEEDYESNAEHEESDSGSAGHEIPNMYAVVTLEESREVMVVPSNWLIKDKKQCYWSPFKSSEKFTKAVKNRSEPEESWEKLAIVFHAEYDTYKQAKKRQNTNEQTEQPATASNQGTESSLLSPGPSGSALSGNTGWSSVKRKRESSYSGVKRKRESSYSDMDIMKMAKQIMDEVNDKIQNINSTDHTTNEIKNNILDAIANMNKIDKENKRKETIGVFGKTGEGKSSLLSAVLGLECLLPSGSLGACTAVITQVEANLEDSNYIAEIELISKEEWENEIASTDERTETDNERIIAVYGDGADTKSLEELKRDASYAEIDNFLSSERKIISHTKVPDFVDDVKSHIEQNESSPGGLYWPLVKSVTIKIPDRRELLEHIVLFDIPGTGDCNKLRDDLWKTKVRECSSVWIVNSIHRAISSKEPWGIIEHCIQDLGPGGQCKNINFICTKTDDINPKEYSGSVSPSEDPISEDKNQKTACILHRNNSAKKILKRKFENMKSKAKFTADVFTVSSKAYFDNKLHLQPSETEIPKLQDVLKSINKSIKKELTRDYVNQAMGILFFIQSVKLDRDKEKASAVHKKYNESLEKALNELNCRFDQLHEILEQCLSEGVKKSVELCVSTTRPVIASVKPADKTLQALFRNKGYYWPKNKDAPIDVNKCLAKHMHDSINDEFDLIFPVDSKNKTGKSVQEQIDKFSIIQSDTACPPFSMEYNIQNFMKTEETKVKAILKREVVHRKKIIYSSIQSTIQDQMTAGYKKATEQKGIGAMRKRETTVIETIEVLKHSMFSDAKMKVMEEFKSLTRHICGTLKSELSRSLTRSLSQSSKDSLMDVSRDIETLETLYEHIIT